MLWPTQGLANGQWARPLWIHQSLMCRNAVGFGWWRHDKWWSLYIEHWFFPQTNLKDGWNPINNGINQLLVGGLEPYFYFSISIGNVIIPTDFHIIQRGWNHQPVISSDWWWLTGTTCPSCGCKKEDVASRWYANGWTVKTPQTTEFSLSFFFRFIHGFHIC